MGKAFREKEEPVLIEVRDLVKRYGDHLAVDHLSFTVERGKIYGFLGPNGAGKSTTMNIMTGYLALTEGEVIVNGHNILTEPAAAKRCIGYLPEIPPLYIDMTVTEYLRFAAQLKGVPKQERKEQLQRVIALTHLEEVQGRLIRNLSKGYRQRVGLAQAILGFPPVIILDEPTVGLDPKQIIEIRDLIRSLAGEHTVILSSHILSEVQEVCDQVLIINHGKLIASGTPAELEHRLSGSTLELTVKSDDAEGVQGTLAALEGVTDLTCVPSANPGELDVTLTCAQGTDLREAVSSACIAAGIPLLMMKSGQVSLEQIFLEVTEDGAAPLLDPEAGESEPGEAPEDGEPSQADEAAPDAQTPETAAPADTDEKEGEDR
jgi:ABC-2 type transport system ATP-binding protein